VHNWSIFGAQMNHGQTWIHKIHYGPNLGEATTFPLIVYFFLATGPAPKCHFFLRLPNGSLKILKIGILATSKAHNFFCKPLIEMRSKAMLYPSSRSFQRYVVGHLHTRKSRRFPSLSGRGSNWQFDSWPFFWP
jgi:hypothetical protein